jgi:adenine-specific DNA glycosylase
MKKKMEMIKRKEMYIVYDYNVNTWYDVNKNSRFIWKKGIEWYDGWISNDMLILLV